MSFLESFRANGKLHLVFEFMDRTLLYDLEQMPCGIPSETVECHMLQLVYAVKFLHDNKVSEPAGFMPSRYRGDTFCPLRYLCQAVSTGLPVLYN